MNDVVFSVHMPHPGTQFHPVQQFIVVSMNAEIDLQFDEKISNTPVERKKGTNVVKFYITFLLDF